MQSILIAYTLAVLSQTGLASYVTVDYWHSTDCSGDSTSLEINGDSCHTGNINAQSYKLTWADIITPNSKLTWYSDGDACIGTSTYTQYVRKSGG